MRVVRATWEKACLERRRSQRDLRAAKLLEMGAAGPETDELAASRENATRCTVLQLAKHAVNWPVSPS
jgi:hypothetical protein